MRALAIVSLLGLAACAATPPPPRETPFSDSLIARSSLVAPAVPAVDESERATEGDEPSRPAEPAAATSPAARQRRIAEDEKMLDVFLASPFSADDLVRLVIHRSDVLATSRASLEAVRTGYRQASDLDDLLALYRSYARDLDTRVGPVRHRLPNAMIAPSPNVSALSGEIVDRSVDLAREALRQTRLDVVTDARRAHASIAHRAEARRIVAEDVRLLEGLLTILRARLETGQVDQTGYLALSSVLARRRTELAVLERKEPALRARLNRLLARPEDAPVTLDLVVDPGDPVRDEAAVLAHALEQSPAVRIAKLRAERAAVAVRLAETMTLPRLDLGGSRFEREQTGEAGVDRGPVFPDPGRMIMPRSDFGVREAQVSEMRARAEAMAAAEKDTVRRIAAAVRQAIFVVTAAEKRLATLTNDVVPYAERALRAATGAYEGNRVGYLDLLDAARGLVAARLDRAEAARDLSVARAELVLVAGLDPEEGDSR